MESRGAAAWKPLSRRRTISKALQAYAAMAAGASRGAVREF
jgi:dihydroxy-acid dehydratase